MAINLPLTLHQSTIRPFDYVIKDSTGEIIHKEDSYVMSSAWNTLEDHNVLRGWGARDGNFHKEDCLEHIAEQREKLMFFARVEEIIDGY